MQINSLNDIVAFIDSGYTGFLATKGTCGNPRVRPVQSALVYNNKIYFATSIHKNLYKHIQNHSGIEYCTCLDDGSFLRLRAEARIANHIDAKEAMMERYPFIRQKYKSPENPDFAVFYLENISAQWQKGSEKVTFTQEF
ncbi:pyridoxamine 5'-phosphate oxidase family protein [Helicobacter sp. 23-1048]